MFNLSANDNIIEGILAIGAGIKGVGLGLAQTTYGVSIFAYPYVKRTTIASAILAKEAAVAVSPVVRKATDFAVISIKERLSPTRQRVTNEEDDNFVVIGAMAIMPPSPSSTIAENDEDIIELHQRDALDVVVNDAFGDNWIRL